MSGILIKESGILSGSYGPVQNGAWSNAVAWTAGVPDFNQAFITNAAGSYTVSAGTDVAGTFSDLTLANAGVNTTRLEIAGGALLGSNGVVSLGMEPEFGFGTISFLDCSKSGRNSHCERGTFLRFRRFGDLALATTRVRLIHARRHRVWCTHSPRPCSRIQIQSLLRPGLSERSCSGFGKHPGPADLHRGGRLVSHLSCATGRGCEPSPPSPPQAAGTRDTGYAQARRPQRTATTGLAPVSRPAVPAVSREQAPRPWRRSRPLGFKYEHL